MSTSHQAAGQPASVPSPWLAVFSIGLATFSVVTTEMLPVGLLNPIADTLNATVGRAGLMISLPAYWPPFLPHWLFSPPEGLTAGRSSAGFSCC